MGHRLEGLIVRDKAGPTVFVAVAVVLFVAALWLVTADVHSDDVRDYGADTSGRGEPESNCGAAYDAALIARGTTRGGDPYSNWRAIDAQCIDNAQERLLMGGASGVAGVVCLLGAAVVSVRRPRAGRIGDADLVTTNSE